MISYRGQVLILCSEGIDTMLNQDIDEPTMTVWANPIVISVKAYGLLRFCFAYPIVKVINVRYFHNSPHMNACIESLSIETVFGMLDASAGYCQIEINSRYRKDIASTSHHGFFLLIGKPYRLCKALLKFGKAMDVILSSIKWRSALVSLNNIVIFLKTVKDYVPLLQ